MDIKEIEVLDEKYPKRLLKNKDKPIKIYALGNLELLNSKKTIGIVGSRNCSKYGIGVTYEFSKELSKNGICIISGMAIGIDEIANTTAIDYEGKTIAVLGGGFYDIYPKENEWLFYKILNNGGCIISEYPPEIKTDTKRMPKRNRIISGLSDAVIIVEAKIKSGTGITAKYAKEQEKEVYVIPSNIDSINGKGTNKLIYNGAKILLSPQELIENKKIEVIMKEEYREIYNILSEKPIHINDIVKKVKRPIDELNSIITMMEIEGYIVQTQTNFFIIRE